MTPDLAARFATCAACKSPVAAKWVKVCRRCTMTLGPVCAEQHDCATAPQTPTRPATRSKTRKGPRR